LLKQRRTREGEGRKQKRREREKAQGLFSFKKSIFQFPIFTENLENAFNCLMQKTIFTFKI